MGEKLRASRNLISFSSRYFSLQKDAYSTGNRTYGVLVDFVAGSIALVIQGKEQSIAFGKGSVLFAEVDQNEQR